MTRTTKAQRHAIKRIMERDHATRMEQVKYGKSKVLFPYMYYRRLAKPTFGCDGAITMFVWNMWLCIERDGYTHS